MLIITGVLLGFVLAAQVGPVTLLIVRSVLRGSRALLVGVAMAFAVALVDLMYAAIGVTGMGQIFNSGGMRLALGLASAAILALIGFRTLWRGFHARSGFEDKEDIVAPGSAFVTAFAATALNPLTMALWTISFPAAAPDTAADSFNSTLRLLSGVGVGTLSWYCGFALISAVVGRWIGPKTLAVVDVITGFGLIGFGWRLGYQVLHHE